MESLTKQVSFQEKEGSTVVGQRVRAVGMVFYGNDDLTVGKLYGLRRNIRLIQKTRTAWNEVLKEAKWSRGDRRVPAKAHIVKVSVTLGNGGIQSESVISFLHKLQKDYEILN
ncbi:hypothetical protein QZH41_015077 [Actinostola sp. cb2023]|nr:hypothetical protein QZH41_015077 [Actinostola sp. cb2023]